MDADKLGVIAGGSLFFCANITIMKHLRLFKSFFFYIIVFHSLALLFFFSGCTKKQHLVTEEEILRRLSIADPKMRLLQDRNTSVSCALYPECKKFFRAQFHELEIFIVELESESTAEIIAKKLHTLNYGNWLFDNLQGEKILIKGIQTAIHADLSKIEPVEAGEGHGAKKKEASEHH